MNATIIYKVSVKSSILDEVAGRLPEIIANVMQVPGGKLAIVRPEQVSLHFSEANVRDVGSDIRVMVFAKSNFPRTASENGLAKEMLEKLVGLIDKSGEACSVDIRLYLMEIGAAEHPLR